jgi:hypothetical protein
VTVFSELIFVKFRLSGHFILVKLWYKQLITRQNWGLLHLLLLLVIMVTLSTTGDAAAVAEL